MNSTRKSPLASYRLAAPSPTTTVCRVGLLWFTLVDESQHRTPQRRPTFESRAISRIAAVISFTVASE